MDAIKVLVVEDIALAAKMSQMILERLGCQIFFAMTGNEAIAKFQQHQFDLVFMDLGLPDIDGLTATQEIRQFEKESNHKQTPIIALTAHTDDEYRQSAMQSGMNDFLSKPLTADNARKMLESYVSSKIKISGVP
jgi:CheY-like chemotaxis protein